MVRNLVLFNGGMTLLLATYAVWLAMLFREIVPLVLVAVLSSIPVALPSMFTLSEAIGARSLAAKGVLPTSLSAVDEAAGMDVLCCDKAGTLTRNELAVLATVPSGQMTRRISWRSQPWRDRRAGRKLKAFTAFDPALKRCEATAKAARCVAGCVVIG